MAAEIKYAQEHDFNQRPRTEGDAIDLGKCNWRYIISIHALARRATAGGVPYSPDKEISIHALARRATLIAPLKQHIKNISIHALARRATRCRSLKASIL